MNNLRVNPWTGVDEAIRIIGEAHTVPSGSSFRAGRPENDIKLAEVPRLDAESSIRVYQSGSPITQNLSEVTYVYEGNPTTNYGFSSFVQTGRDGVGLHYRYRALMAVSTLSGLPSVVDRVTLRTYLNNTSGSGGYPGERTIGVHALQAGFVESGVTWSNQPAHNLVAAASFKTTVAGWYDSIITSIYQQWISSGNNYGLLLKDGNDPDTDNIRQFSSENGANVPRLIIDEPGDTFVEVAANITPGPGQVSVNYDLGLLRFNNADIGKAILVDYWGRGSLVWA